MMPLQPPDDPSGRLAGVVHNPDDTREFRQALGRVLPHFDGGEGEAEGVGARLWLVGG